MSASPYREVRTREQLAQLLHYGFHIPMARGFTRRHVDEHYPGWTWNSLLRILSGAGVVVVDPGSPLRCHERVVRVHFDSEEAWLVEWDDSTTTRGPKTPGASVADTTRGREHPVFDLAIGLMVEDLGR